MKEIKNIINAFKKYKNNPEYTSKLALKKAKYSSWLILEQNLKKNSTFSQLVNEGVSVQHIIHENSNYYGFILNGAIYLNPSFITNYTPYYNSKKEYINTARELFKLYNHKTTTIGDIKISYIPPNNPKNSAPMVYWKGTRHHLGIKHDKLHLIKKEHKQSA